MLNTRFKDYFDLHYLCNAFEFRGKTLVQAIGATFARRGTLIPPALPVGLTATVFEDGVKQTQWAAFRRRLGEQKSPESLADTVNAIVVFLEQPLRATASSSTFSKHWKAGGPWLDA